MQCLSCNGCQVLARQIYTESKIQHSRTACAVNAVKEQKLPSLDVWRFQGMLTCFGCRFSSAASRPLGALGRGAS